MGDVEYSNRNNLVQFLYGVKDFHFSFGRKCENFNLPYFSGVTGSLGIYVVGALHLLSMGREIESLFTALMPIITNHAATRVKNYIEFFRDRSEEWKRERRIREIGEE